MLVVLKATTDGSRPQRLQLRAHQVASIGRSELADFCISSDTSMADVQFEIRSTADSCSIRSLALDPPTLINGQQVETSMGVQDGDHIQAGRTRFVVHLEGDRRATLSPATIAPDATLSQAPAPTMSLINDVKPAVPLVATCAYLEFSDDVGTMATQSKTSDDLISRLAEQERFQDALRLRGHLLTKRQAVWWGCLCVRDVLEQPLPAQQLPALKAAAAWVGEPNEENRRKAEDQAAAAKYGGIGATLALSAFWSEGSIAPAGNPDVTPDERLTSQGVAAALVTAAYHGDPKKANDRFRAFLAKGRDIADEKIPLPEGEVEW